MNRNVRQIQAGWNVYGSDDAKVGDVAEVGAHYALVQKGWLFTRPEPSHALTAACWCLNGVLLYNRRYDLFRACNERASAGL